MILSGAHATSRPLTKQFVIVNSNAPHWISPSELYYSVLLPYPSGILTIVYALNILIKTFPFFPEKKNETPIYYAAHGKLGALG